MVITLNNKITNAQKEVPTGIALNDKDYMSHLLTMLKDYEKNMAVVLTEASNENLYNIYKSMFDEFTELQREAYELMFRFGWYTLELATKTKSDSLYKTLQKELDSLNN